MSYYNVSTGDSSHARRICIHGFVALLLLTLIGSATLHAAIPASERAVLLNLYTQTKGDDWFIKSGWNGAPRTECSWYGITCNPGQTTIMQIDLSGDLLQGTLPSISALSNLEEFDVGNHPPQSSGTPVSSYIGNQIGGTLPSLAGMTHLRTFVANASQLTGAIPDLSTATGLEHFDVSQNQLTGMPVSLAGLTNLAFFDVSNNQLRGTIPALTGLTQLATFRVDSNQLTGSIPSLAGLTSLDTFSAGFNQLTGSLPALDGLVNLTVFDVGGNFLSGNLPALANLPKLQTLALATNQFTGPIPELTGLPNLQALYLGGNLLSGGIPDLSTLTSLQKIGVSFNALTATLPAPPSSLVAGGSYLCPNSLSGAADPPSDIDLAWDTATGITPWSRDCIAAPKPSAVWLSSTRNPSNFGDTVTFIAIVYGDDPSGTVTFSSHIPLIAGDTTLCASVPLINGRATCTQDRLPAGSTNDISATYSGDSQNAANADIYAVAQNVGYAVASSLNPSQVGQAVILDTAFSNSGNATGSVTFLDGATPLCANVPLTTINSIAQAYCEATFASSGTHTLTARITLGNTAYAANPLEQTVTDAVAFDADQFALTGAWYNPPTSGQGLLTEVFTDSGGAGLGTLFGGWFMFDAGGDPQWVTLQGNITAAHAASYNLGIYETVDGNFNAGPIVHAAAAGSGLLTFTDCTHAVMTYLFNDGRNGTIAYVRLDNAAACSTAVPATTPMPLPANYNDALHSGAWYNPATSGQGLVVDISPLQTTLFAAWYTFVPQSEASTYTGTYAQRWFTLQTNQYTPGDLNLANVPIYSTQGTIVNGVPNVSTTQVGTANVDFTSCNAMTLQYTFTQGEFSGLTGSIEEQTGIPVAGCQ